LGAGVALVFFGRPRFALGLGSVDVRFVLEEVVDVGGIEVVDIPADTVADARGMGNADTGDTDAMHVTEGEVVPSEAPSSRGVVPCSSADTCDHDIAPDRTSDDAFLIMSAASGSLLIGPGIGCGGCVDARGAMDGIRAGRGTGMGRWGRGRGAVAIRRAAP